MTYDELLTVREAAAYLKSSKSWIDKLRVYGGGPRYTKIGKRVLYRRVDIDNWLFERERASTAENSRGATR